MSEDSDTPRTAVERALVSDRLDRVEDRLAHLEGLALSSDRRLARLVELAEARDAREVEEARWHREQEAARATWLRSVVSREVLVPLAAALAGLVGGHWGLGALAAPPTFTEAPPAVTAPGPSGPSGPQETP